ncbi:MAG: AmmeMemoRadiSam system protein B [Nitrospiraceae bacterium]|nr:MAG: AmmeMemoRadiSam system protein B [Nitrospiraceae bacterium]
MKRKPAVSGQFYPSSPSKLTEQVRGFIQETAVKDSVIGIVSPHAGLMYSGAVAGAVFSRIKFPHTFILVGPNHTGLGSPVSIMSSGEWQMPTGELKIDSDIAEKIIKRSCVMEEDARAHTAEHSIEVQLPFILYYSSDVRIVPIVMMGESLETCREVGGTLADVIKEAEYPVTIVASSDMSHYVSDPAARSKDKKATDMVLALDPEGLYSAVGKEGITMCGFMPVTTMLFAARKLGAQKAELVKYMTSGEVSGDYDYVVGYAGMIIR